MKCFRCSTPIRPDFPWCDCDDGICIINAQCASVRKIIDDVDHIVTDPPWKASTSGRKKRNGGDVAFKYGDVGILDMTEIRAWLEIANYDSLVHCGYIEVGDIISAQITYRGLLVWNDTRSTPIPGPIQRDASFVVWGGKQTSIINRAGWKTSVFKIPSLQAGTASSERFVDSCGRSLHPCQEPLALYRQLIHPFQGTIADPFMGTGTTLRAAKDCGLKAIGIELNSRYCELAAGRLRQKVMFQ